MTMRQPMAFFHEDGLARTWDFAMRYAGSGHIATLPEIVEACIATGKDNLIWNMYLTTNSAEYYGIGADGREKLIIAHGIGPMSSLQGITKAYSWTRRDRERGDGGGHISKREFLDLEAGLYGNVEVIDAREYLEVWRENAFGCYSALLGCINPLLTTRLGPRTHDYLSAHDEIARWWHENMSISYPEGEPYIVQCQTAANCPYMPYFIDNDRFEWPQIAHKNFAIGHLLTVSGLVHTIFNEGRYLINSIGYHRRSDGVRFIGVPSNTSWQSGIAVAPQPSEVLRRDWQRLMLPINKSLALPPLHLLERTDNDEWFTRYAKPIDEECMDFSDIEFHVNSLELVGDARFKVDADFFLRYKLSQVINLAPANANAYEIVNIGSKDNKGIMTVTIRFYKADVDTTQKLPRAKEIKLDYNQIMGLD